MKTSEKAKDLLRRFRRYFWQTLGDPWTTFFRRIFRFPWKLATNIPFLLYFIIVICVIGAFGAIIPAAQHALGNATVTALSAHRSLATYVIAIAVTALADFLTRGHGKDDVPFVLFLLGLAIVVAGCAVTVLLIDNMIWVTKLSWIGTSLAAWNWLIVNDEHPNLTSSDPYAALGGNSPV